MSAALALEGLHADRGQSRILRGVDLSLRHGELVVVTGPNGAGKTTLVEVIAGILPPTRGSVVLNGSDVTGKPFAQRAALGLGLTPERRRLVPTMTVEENLRVAARTWGLPRRRVRERIDELAVDIPVVGERRQEPVARLSGGQQQLVAIARSLICRPSVLVLDEPSFGLAPGTWASVVQICRGLADHGNAVLLVEQRVLDVTGIADAVHVLNSGRVHQVDIESLANSDEFFRGRPT